MPALYKLEDGLLRWPLPPGAQAYAAIDGKHIHQYVVEQAAISRRYRDQGHPMFWGRIIGESSDTESAEWVADKFKKTGLTDVHIQPFDLIPQWRPQSWEVTATGGGKTLHLERSAQPAYGTTGTTGQGLDVEAVYVGLGTEADFMGKDVRGKAVFLYSLPKPSGAATIGGGAKRAQDKGAVAVFDVMTLPGNMRYQSYPSNATIPSFNLGLEDGNAMRELIEKAPAGQAPRVKIKLDVARVPNLKTSIVWGTLPGATDETIYIIAHRDGWFDASGDNAGGVGSMIALAEYYAKIPQAQRRRTMVFLGMDGHHNSGEKAGVGREWLVANRDKFFTKTALMINCEHPSTLQSYHIGDSFRWSNFYTSQQWYAGSPSRPKLQEISLKAFADFGVPTYVEPNRNPPAGDLGRFFWFLPGVATSDFYHYFHTDGETPDTVPWTGLEASTRAYAKIIDEVNKLALSDLERAPEPDPRAPAPAQTASAAPARN